MATLVKNFKVKSGLVVEGSTGTINGYDILTKKEADQSYIIGLIGGSATPDATPDTVVLRDENADFSANMITSDLTGDVTGTVSDISNHSTDDLTEGTNNKYFSDTLAKDAVAAALGDGIEYESGSFNVQIATGLVLAGGTGNEIEIDRETVDGWYDANGSAAAAQTAAESYADGLAVNYDAVGSAAAAEASANSYTDDEISELDLALKAYADQAEADAVTSANSYTDGRETAITTAYQSYADTAEADAKAYADQKVTDLIGGAPGILDTLKELADAIDNDADFVTTIENQIALKADLTYVNDELSDLGSEAQGYADAAETAANSYTDGKITQEVADRNDAISTAITTEIADRNTAIGVAIDQEVLDRNSAITTAVDALDTDDIEEGETNLYFTNQRAIDAVGGTIGDAIDELDTDDIEEGSTNLYYTTTRAKTDAAALLVGATKTNIEITGDENGLTITAENGVADSDTDDLAEGTTNLYFTDERAVDALQGTDSTFATVDINEVALQVAATTGEVSVAGIQTAYAWAKADYRSAEFLVKVAYGTHTEISKVLLTLDTSDNIAITEYGIVGTNGSASTISAAIVDDEVELQVTTANNNSTITVVGTLLA
jgi:hypothetical protein